MEQNRTDYQTIQDQWSTGRWCVVELLGHRRVAGIVRAEEIAGHGFLRLDIPTEGDEFTTQYLGPGSIYALTPTTPEVARAIAANAPQPISEWDVRRLLPAVETHPPDRGSMVATWEPERDAPPDEDGWDDPVREAEEFGEDEDPDEIPDTLSVRYTGPALSPEEQASVERSGYDDPPEEPLWAAISEREGGAQ